MPRSSHSIRNTNETFVFSGAEERGGGALIKRTRDTPTPSLYLDDFPTTIAYYHPDGIKLGEPSCPTIVGRAPPSAYTVSPRHLRLP
jgi:hypothetical protein